MYEQDKVHRELMQFFGLNPSADAKDLVGTSHYSVYLYVMGMRNHFENEITKNQEQTPVAKGALIFDTAQVEELCKTDAEIINKAFEHSEELGADAIRGSIGNFIELLKSHKGEFIPALDLDYRSYIIQLLNFSMDMAKNEGIKSSVFSHIVIPSSKSKPEL